MANTPKYGDFGGTPFLGVPPKSSIFGGTLKIGVPPKMSLFGVIFGPPKITLFGVSALAVRRGPNIPLFGH